MLAAIGDTKSALQQDINVVSIVLGLLQTNHHKLAVRVKDVETVVGELHLDHLALTRQVTNLSDTVRTLEHCADAAEGRNSHNNVRTVGLPEGTEGGDVVSYLEHWLQTEVDPSQLLPFFVLEHAYMMPA
ncbi:hypothetical protein NDU88_003125 [Pleurodeles waltl]|uniref:Uncharacterized protein n=1 Tax=Pleurodeles waltl TaxID=8319 RepID=A0AAV7KXA6_PLEWA|nr:hypothetical protein NDU88_003125 [Pleurodeles waltl]